MPRIIKDMKSRFEAVSLAQAKPGVTTDTRKAIEEVVGKNFDQIEVGAGMILPIPKDKTGLGFMAIVRSRIISGTRIEEPFAGRVYKIKLQKEDATKGVKESLLLMRDADGEPLPRKKGGRTKGSGNKAKSEETKSEGIAGLEAAKAHLSGGQTVQASTNDGDGKVPEPEKVAATETPVKDLTAPRKKNDKPA